MKIKKEARHLLMFMLLGDGTVTKNGVFKILHCEKQLDYLTWKKNKLNECGIQTNNIVKYDNNGFNSNYFTVKVCKFTKLLRRIFYKPNKIISKRTILNKLTPLGLAIWYMDDGGLSQKKRNGKVHANDLMLNTHLSKEENQIIINYFKEVWNIQFTQVLNRGLYRLRCGTKEARKFIKIIYPYIVQVDSMKHKIDIKLS